MAFNLNIVHEMRTWRAFIYVRKVTRQDMQHTSTTELSLTRRPVAEGCSKFQSAVNNNHVTAIMRHIKKLSSSWETPSQNYGCLLPSCHMGSYSVTCHPTQANIPRLNQPQPVRLVLGLSTPEGWKAELTWCFDYAQAGSRTRDRFDRCFEQLNVVFKFT